MARRHAPTSTVKDRLQRLESLSTADIWWQQTVLHWDGISGKVAARPRLFALFRRPINIKCLCRLVYWKREEKPDIFLNLTHDYTSTCRLNGFNQVSWKRKKISCTPSVKWGYGFLIFVEIWHITSGNLCFMISTHRSRGGKRIRLRQLRLFALALPDEYLMRWWRETCWSKVMFALWKKRETA